MVEIIKPQCPRCGSDCYIWCESDITDALTKNMNKEFPIYCINDCGIVGSIDGKVILKKNTLKMNE